MTELTTTRWRRYGQDRLYVKTHDGIDVGYIDLQTGDVDLAMPELEAEVRSLASHMLRIPDTRAMPIVTAVAPAGYDLADNAAGGAARTKHEAVKAQAPMRNLLARLLNVKTEERAWRIGSQAELRVGRQLAKLPGDWHALHAIPIGDRGSDIDHLIVGPGGVFNVNTKCHPDATVWLHEQALRVNGYITDYLRNTRFETERVTRLLTTGCGMPVESHGMIVFVDLTKITIKGTPADVMVTTMRGLRNVLLRQPVRLTPAQVEHIYSVARNSLTWQRQLG
jgi:hypothetical protein